MVFEYLGLLRYIVSTNHTLRGPTNVTYIVSIKHALRGPTNVTYIVSTKHTLRGPVIGKEIFTMGHFHVFFKDFQNFNGPFPI